MSTVFIIGAGASTDADFPTGDSVRSDITELLDFKFDEIFRNKILRGSPEILEALRNHIRGSAEENEDLNRYLEAARHVAHSIKIAPSIDHLIEAHSEDKYITLVSKLAIAKSIKEYEASSSVRVDPGNIYNRMNFEHIDKSTWYRELFNILFLGRKVCDIESVLAATTFIIFNYDRCLEYVLFHLLKDFFNLSPEEAQDFMLKAKFFHPYGSLGHLGLAVPATNFLGDFAFKGNPHSILQMARSLRTFSEGTDEDSSEIVSIRNALKRADQIVCLGFAYHEINLRLLAVDGPTATIPLFGTTKGISDPNLATIKSDLLQYLKPIRIEAFDKMTCRDFLKGYSGPIGRIHRDTV